jgi:hypothetical protein
MKHFATILLLSLLPAVSSATTITNAIEEAVLTGKAIGILTSNDVPAHWRLSLKTGVDGKYTTSTYSRGTNTVLKVRWGTEWKDDLQEYFTGRILDGTTTVTKVSGTQNGIVVSPSVDPARYEILVIVSKTTNSAVTVRGVNGFYEIYLLDGRKTAPLDEVQYMKTRYFEDFAWKPLAAIVTNSTDRPPNQTMKGEK